MVSNNKEIIEKLKNIDLLYLASQLGFTPRKKSTNFYCLEEHDSFMIKISNNTFQWYSRGNYGNAIAMCRYLGSEVDKRFLSYDYTLKFLENLYMQMKDDIVINSNKIKNTIQKNSSNLVLPHAAGNNKKIYYYLENRCISEEIINYFIDNKWLYQNRDNNNLVFVSYKNDRPVFICEKGIIKEKRFMMEYSDNDYNHCFYINHHSDTILVTEAIVDMMSIMTLEEEYKKYNYLSINSVTKYEAIFSHVKNDPKIKKVLLRVDNDLAGINLVKKVIDRFKSELPQIKLNVDFPKSEKDWNDYLVHVVNRKEKIDEYTIIF